MPGSGYLTATLGDLASRVAARLAELRRREIVPRIWDRDPTVWGGTAETPELADRLAWLDTGAGVRAGLTEAAPFFSEVSRRFTRVVLCGMGGSSLAPEVIVRSCPARPGSPRFTMLDSTAPAAVAGATDDPARTAFVISSKSGSTIETLSFHDYFWHAAGRRGEQFVAITDPGSALEQTARAGGFAHVFAGDPEIGGRFSALSPFGLVPAALAGVEIDPLVAAAAEAAAGAHAAPGPDNPGAWLGAILGEAARAGRDKLVLALSPGLRTFGLWVEQLIAESTGKAGVGILPVTGVRSEAAYGADRVIVTLRLATEPWAADLAGRLTQARDRAVPVVDLVLDEPAALGGEFFRWEFATAVAGAILGVNPFDQPNVAESKTNTNAVLSGVLHPDAPADPEAAREIVRSVAPGDYLAILAYVAPSPERDAAFAAAAERWEGETGAAVTWGYGPRYLHSTGQLHKGGPPRGAFLQVVEDPPADLEIPGREYTFGQLFAAQADGDYAALKNRGRPVARVRSIDEL